MIVIVIVLHAVIKHHQVLSTTRRDHFLESTELMFNFFITLRAFSFLAQSWQLQVKILLSFPCASMFMLQSVPTVPRLGLPPPPLRALAFFEIKLANAPRWGQTSWSNAPAMQSKNTLFFDSGLNFILIKTYSRQTESQPDNSFLSTVAMNVRFLVLWIYPGSLMTPSDVANPKCIVSFLLMNLSLKENDKKSP